MQWQEILSLIIEFARLLLPGIVGGLIVYWLGPKTFKSQKRLETKYQDDLRRRQALSDIHVVLDIVFADIHRNWKMPKGSTDTPEQHISRLVEMYNRTRILFLNDREMLNVLDKFHSLIGESFELSRRSGKEPHKIIAEIREKIESRIKELEKSLY